MRKYLLLFLVALLFYSCQEKAFTSSSNGVWKSIGHGKVLEIRDSSSYAFYHITPSSCVPVRKSNYEEIEGGLSLRNDTLQLMDGRIIYKFVKSNELPEICANFSNNEKVKDPIYNFEVFMETVKEHYAFLALNEINWDELYKTQKDKLKASPTAVNLFLLIEETFEKLNDNHAYLEADNELYEELDKLPAEENNEEEATAYGDFPTANRVAKHYLKEDMTKYSWLIKWGKMTEEIGFIQIKAMWLFADLDLKQELIDSIGYVDAYGSARTKMFEGNYVKKEVEGVEKIMNKVMNDLANTESMVMDVRFNGGGQDLVSLKILSYFNAKKIHVATSKFRFGNQFTEPQKQYLEANSNAYTNPVYVLTSPTSGSAAEVFALATMPMPNVKRIGSATEGALSTTLDKKLPIGWEFCLSNEEYTDTKGKFYENAGIPVDYELNYPRGRQRFFGYIVDNLEKDKQTILKAIEELKK